MINAGFTELLLGALAILLIVAAVIDVRTFTISNRLNAAVALLAPFYWWSLGLPLWPDVAIQVGMAIAVFAVLAVTFYVGMMGGGDVKLAAAVALWLAPAETLRFLVFMTHRRRAGDDRRADRASRPVARPAGPRFRTASRLQSAPSSFSPNGFLTNLRDL